MFPTLLVIDGSCLIDHRMGIHGHPLKIEVLFYSSLLSSREILALADESPNLTQVIAAMHTLKAALKPEKSLSHGFSEQKTMWRSDWSSVGGEDGLDQENPKWLESPTALPADPQNKSAKQTPTPTPILTPKASLTPNRAQNHPFLHPQPPAAPSPAKTCPIQREGRSYRSSQTRSLRSNGSVCPHQNRGGGSRGTKTNYKAAT
ncbi:hypothetical protein Nepgr_019163 [Nepenthes gracilis]|uniref:Alkaline/neutral invertase n=1 Tax=Nepenthes gracilis TaxID=150966 RepID=A0AAD3XTT0_NEPGR|nr:hypothetical protein Nepgr_019163 [Nepenthes gracilis]